MMKNNFIIALLLIIHYNSFSQKAFVPYTDIDRQNQEDIYEKAGVKSCKMTIFEYKLKLQDFEPDGRLADIYQYDENGQMTEKTAYFANASKKEKYVYNQDMKIVQKENYLPASVLKSKEIFAYKDNGDIIQSTKFNHKNTIIATTKYEYGERTRTQITRDTLDKLKSKMEIRLGVNGAIEEHFLYNWKDEMYKHEIIEYNELGQKIKWTIIDKSFNQHNISEYDLDEKGNIVKENVFNKDGELKRYTESKYDDHQLITESILFSKDGAPRTKYVYEYEFY
ncbi:MAG: hypothetical protein C0594_09050 [Marinilabiliales bacterium]|nr:MAG: hypothetical protein C0594_09050 [Marinilabiliales bacterium]